MGGLWAVLSADCFLAYEEAGSAEEAVEAFAKKAGIPKEGLCAIPGDKVRGDVWVPRWLVDALEHGPEESATWDDFWKGIDTLESRGIRIANIVGWLKVHNRDFWVPVVK